MHLPLPLTLLLSAATVAAADQRILQLPLKDHNHHHHRDGLPAIPHLGFGTWNLKSTEHNASQAVSHALISGYRHIDCAAAYRNEPDVGYGIRHGLKRAGLKREDIWVTSKLWNNRHDPAQVEKALDATLQDLGVGYLDLYLMHWPVATDENGENSEEFLKTWKAMGKLSATGKVRHIGVCNFSPKQLNALLAAGKGNVRPYAHQMEMHPYLPQTAWLQYHASQGIHVTAYSPLANSNPTYDVPHKDKVPPFLLKNNVVTEIASRRDCSPAQVVLAWGLSRGQSVIPKSSHPSRIEENFAASKCGLEYEDLIELEKLGNEPFRFNNPSDGWKVKLFDGLQDS